MSKKNILAGIFFVAILLLSIIATNYFVFNEEEIVEFVEEKTIDDRISPLNENQGLVFEVLRIRHRGLYDKFMTPGTSWRKKPTFYYTLTIDDLEFNSKNVEGPGFSDEFLFNDWDTMFRENKIMKDVQEEQPTSKIELTVFEIIQTGLIFKKNTEHEREKIKLTYDYRTGRWTGDDSFKDYDGYGHYLGDTFEIWFNAYQMDNDMDNIPYWTEVNVLGTDPTRDDSKRDPDKDGIPTSWEWKWGYDPFSWDDHERLDPDIDGLENIEEYQMAKWLADPFSQDIYVEVDWMEGAGIFDPPHIFYKESQYAIVEKFSEHNIRMYIDDGWPGGPTNGGGEELDHIESVSQDSGMILQWYRNNFPDERKGIFRYLVFGHIGNFNHPAVQNRYDVAFLSYAFELKQIIIGAVNKGIINARTWRGKVASSAMHELGHSIGISPWNFEGCDNYSYANGRQSAKEYEETWGNYYSVMNYYVQYNTDLLDYSDGRNGPPYDQNDWEKIYLPTFQQNSEVIEDLHYETPGTDKILPEEAEFEVYGYIYDKELTEQFIKSLDDWSPVDPINVDWRVFKSVDIDDDSKCINIYARPNVPPARWTFSYEGYIKNGELSFYSVQDMLSIFS